jgi:hypothetical protein
MLDDVDLLVAAQAVARTMAANKQAADSGMSHPLA